MKNLIFFFELLTICLCSCSDGQSNEAVLSQSSAQWKNDLNYLAIQLPKLHKNSFHTISKEAFQQQVNILSQKIDLLSDDQIITELVSLVALVGDGHTHLDLPPGRIPSNVSHRDVAS